MDGGSTIGQDEIQRARSWAVVETRPNAEAIAECAILRLDVGYRPLVVRYNKLIRGVRFIGDRRVRSRGDTIQSRPFIPGYLFLPLEAGDDATLIDGCNGVKRLFRRRDAEGYLAAPRLIRASVVEQVKRAADEMDETPQPVRTDIKPGD